VVHAAVVLVPLSALLLVAAALSVRVRRARRPAAAARAVVELDSVRAADRGLRLTAEVVPVRPVRGVEVALRRALAPLSTTRCGTPPTR
jgi:hypothetical protein